MSWMDLMIRILLSVSLGFFIGLEQQITGHTAGIRINILLSMGSCLFLMLPIIAGSGLYLFAVAATGTLILSNLLFRFLAMKVKPVTSWEESEKLYRISITCRETWENDIRALLINGNTCKTLYLNQLDSGDVVGDKVEVIAEIWRTVSFIWHAVWIVSLAASSAVHSGLSGLASGYGIHLAVSCRNDNPADLQN